MPEANMFLEKRVHPRVPVKIAVKYRVIEEQKEIESVFERKNRDKTSQTLDISLGGLYIVADQVIAAGSILRLDIEIPNHPSMISAFAEVAWSNESGLGLHFLAMKDTDVDVMKDYLDKAQNQK
jgi:c-di-GMP-binding flagellar brake protein YcgR